MIRRRRRSINQKPSAPPSTVINPTSNRGGDGGGTQPGYLLSPTLAAAPSTTFGLSSSSVLNDSVMTSAVKTSGAAIYPPDRKGSSSLVQVELAPPLRSDVKRPYLDEKKSFMFSNNAIGTEYAAHDVPMRENPSREGLRGTVEVARMPTDELVAWLTSAGVASHLVEILKANNVTGFSFLVLSETKLSEMKIPATSARLIMALVNDCRRSGGGGFTHDGPSYMHRGATIAADGEAPPLYTT
ncbi:hypothetical protein BC829DRAFT_282536 [Chytridium lagenaria]|nr:hypothetical protein BC829DRAFT_282536 [Chytridium lagenaria]